MNTFYEAVIKAAKDPEFMKKYEVWKNEQMGEDVTKTVEGYSRDLRS